MHPQDAALGPRYYVGLRLEKLRERTRGGSASRPVRLADGRHHPGLGQAAGDHMDDVGEQPLVGGQRIRYLALAEFGDREVRGRPSVHQYLSVLRSDLNLPTDLAAVSEGSPPERVADAVAQHAEPVSQTVDPAVQLAPDRIDGARRPPAWAVPAPAARPGRNPRHVPEAVLLRPPGEQRRLPTAVTPIRRRAPHPRRDDGGTWPPLLAQQGRQTEEGHLALPAH